jgi:N-acetylmuramoyl-L-alanine amidase
MQNIYLKQSTEFATMIQNQFRDRVGRKDRGVRQAGFVVLWRTTMPSVLIELGFISNPEEEKYLNSAQGQDYLASAIYRAFRDYKQTIDSRSGLKPGGTQQVAENKEVGAVSTGNPATGGDGSQVNDNAGKPATVSNTRPVNDSTVRPASGSTGKPVNDSAAKPVPVFRSNDTTPVQAQDSVPVYNKPPPPVTAANDILFMVQVSAMPKNREMTPSQLKGLEPVTKIEDGERTKYAAGRFPVYDDALKYRRILTLRFPDAFVIAVRNGKIMPLREAIEAKK